MKSILSALALTVALGGVACAESQFGEDKWQKIDPENTLFLELKDGTVVIALHPEVAPGHVKHIKELAREGFYNGTPFHRVIDGFMAQGGDPTGTGTGGSNKPDITAEFTFHTSQETLATDDMRNKLSIIGPSVILTEPDSMQFVRASGKLESWMPHCKGTTSMARASNPNSANSQFFLMFSEYPSLDRKYSSWGKIVYGQALVDQIKRGEPVQNPDKIVSMQVGSDVPAADRMEFEVMTADSITVVENIERATKNGYVRPCAVEIPVRKIESAQ